MRNLLFLSVLFVSIAFVKLHFEESWNVPVSIGEFKSFAQLKVVEHSVLPGTTSVWWYYSATAKGHKDCGKANVTLFIQHGSFPVFRVSEATFPRHGYYLHRTGLVNHTFSANTPRQYVRLNYPLPGRWFASAYVHAQTDDVIKVLTTEECSYSMSVNLSSCVVDEVTEMLPGAETGVKLENHGDFTGRVMISSTVWRMNVKVSKCVVDGTAANSSCPIIMQLSSGAPLSDQSAFVLQNCSAVEEKTCTMSLYGPSVEQWQYLYITNIAPQQETVSFKVVIYNVELPCARSAVQVCPGSEYLRKRSVPADANTPPADKLTTAALNQHANNLHPDREFQVFLPPDDKSQLQLHGDDSVIADASSLDILDDMWNETFNGTTNVDISYSNITIELDLEPTVKSNIPVHPNTFTAGEDSAIMTSPKMAVSSTASLTSTVTRTPAVSTRNVDVAPSGATNALEAGGGHDVRQPGTCEYLRYMRFQNPGNEFRTVFYYAPRHSKSVTVGEAVSVSRFDLKSPHDLGGNLVVSLTLQDTNMNHSAELVLVRACIQKHRLPVNDTYLLCHDAPRDLVTMDTGLDQWSARIVYPYPEPGAWFIGLQAYCYPAHGISNVSVPCMSSYIVLPEVSMEPVGDCRNEGFTTSTLNGPYLMSYCSCRAGYAGFICTDSTHAASLHTQLAYTLMLTLSNLAFIPAILVALSRRYYVEALVYFANMFFSSFYHACDVAHWSVYMMCIAPYHVLSYSDFFCSIMSFWVTLLAMAELPRPLASVAHMAGAIALVMGVEWNEHGLITYIVPFSVGGAIVLLAWIVRCKRRHRFYPRPKQWLFIIPGLLLAGGGLSMFLLIETDANYPYTHSVWHLCMATSIVFLLPWPHARGHKDSTDTASRESDNSLELDDGLAPFTSERAGLVCADALDTSAGNAFDHINVEL